MTQLSRTDRWLFPEEVRIVEAAVRAAGTTCVRDLVARTRLSSTAVIPILGELVADGHVHRRARTGSDGHRTWVYRMPAARRRALSSTRTEAGEQP